MCNRLGLVPCTVQTAAGHSIGKTQESPFAFGTATKTWYEASWHCIAHALRCALGLTNVMGGGWGWGGMMVLRVWPSSPRTLP